MVISICFIVVSIIFYISVCNCLGIVLFLLGLFIFVIALLPNKVHKNVEKYIKFIIFTFIAMVRKNRKKTNNQNIQISQMNKNMQIRKPSHQQEAFHVSEESNPSISEVEVINATLEDDKPLDSGENIDSTPGGDTTYELCVLTKKHDNDYIEISFVSNPKSKIQYKIDSGGYVDYVKPFTVKHNCTIVGKSVYDDGTSLEKVANINSFVLLQPIISENNRIVSISSNDKDVEIYYTLDGTHPNRNSLKYEKPFAIKKSCKILAFTCKVGYKDSDIISANIEVIIKTEERVRQFTNELSVIGISYQGEGHIRNFIPCQDFHSYKRISENWSIAIVSDGAGSAKYSADGSKAVCLAFTHYIEDYLIKLHPNGSLPNDKEWDIEFRGMLHKFQIELSKQAEAQSIEFKSLAATIIIIAYSNQGYLVAHIGDGRAAIKTAEGWQAIITPHKGEEANQTIFSTSIVFSKYPNLKMSGVYVPETYVGQTCIKAFALMTDGCEDGLWHVRQKVDLPNGDFRIEERNIPYSKGLDDALSILNEPSNLKEKKLIEFITSYNNPLAKELDDKSILIGIVR